MPPSTETQTFENQRLNIPFGILEGRAKPHVKPHAVTAPDFQRYQLLNNAVANSEIVLLEKRGLITSLMGDGLERDRALDGLKDPKPMEASLDFLDIQKFLRLEDGVYKPTKKGIELVHDLDRIKLAVSCYEGIAQVIKRGLGLKYDSRLINERVERLITKIEGASYRDLQALAPAAISYFYGKDLASGDLDDSPESRVFAAVLKKLRVLRNTGVLNPTEAGKNQFELGGNMMLESSYYAARQYMHEQATGKMPYKLGLRNYRDAELNAHASNRMLEKRVTPYIIDSLNGETDNDEINQKLAEALKDVNAHVDFGMGEGGLLREVAEKGPESTKVLHGMDFNKATVKEAERQRDLADLSKPIHFTLGDITNPENLIALRGSLRNAGVNKISASINFILHDIGYDMAEKFLKLFKKLFPGSVLIVSESVKMPIEVLRNSPHHVNSVFEDEHTISHQELQTYESWKGLFEKCGFRNIHERAYSKIPNVDPEMEKLESPISFFLKA